MKGILNGRVKQALNNCLCRKKITIKHFSGKYINLQFITKNADRKTVRSE